MSDSQAKTSSGGASIAWLCSYSRVTIRSSRSGTDEVQASSSVTGRNAITLTNASQSRVNSLVRKAGLAVPKSPPIRPSRPSGRSPVRHLLPATRAPRAR
jgi:hypothetical protein